MIKRKQSASGRISSGNTKQRLPLYISTIGFRRSKSWLKTVQWREKEAGQQRAPMIKRQRNLPIAARWRKQRGRPSKRSATQLRQQSSERLRRPGKSAGVAKIPPHKRVTTTDDR